MKTTRSLLAVFLLMFTLVACTTSSLSIDSDNDGIHAVAKNGANGEGNGSILIEDDHGLCINHIVNKGSFHVKATDESGVVVFEKELTDNIADFIPVQGEFDLWISAHDADGTIDIIAYDIAAQIAADDSLDETLEKTNLSREELGIAKPWYEVKTAEEAAKGASVGSFSLPDATTTIAGQDVNWLSYRYMEGIAEADGTVGETQLIVRKGLRKNGDDISGDYNVYSLEWELQSNESNVMCAGNDSGKARKAFWTSQDYSYSIMLDSQDDTDESPSSDGLSDQTIIELVEAIH